MNHITIIVFMCSGDLQMYSGAIQVSMIKIAIDSFIIVLR